MAPQLGHARAAPGAPCLVPHAISANCSRTQRGPRSGRPQVASARLGEYRMPAPVPPAAARWRWVAGWWKSSAAATGAGNCRTSSRRHDSWAVAGAVTARSAESLYDGTWGSSGVGRCGTTPYGLLGCTRRVVIESRNVCHGPEMLRKRQARPRTRRAAPTPRGWEPAYAHISAGIGCCRLVHLACGRRLSYGRSGRGDQAAGSRHPQRD